MTEDMKQKRDELAERYGGYTFGHGSKVNGFAKGFDACYKLMEAENAELTRMRLVAISVAANSNTTESLDKVLECAEEYKTLALSDVVEAIRREIKLREENSALKSRIEKLRAALEHYNQWDSCNANNPTEYDLIMDRDCGCCSCGSAGAVAYKALKADEVER